MPSVTLQPSLDHLAFRKTKINNCDEKRSTIFDLLLVSIYNLSFRVSVTDAIAQAATNTACIADYLVVRIYLFVWVSMNKGNSSASCFSDSWWKYPSYCNSVPRGKCQFHC